ncbi:MAG: 3'-5' exonuclease [Ruminococcus sp.]|nr:3'-5' exonuclease [Ruminococcus sp.]
MERYIVFDVETPNRANDRMSAIGISVIENGRITESFFSLVDPETHFDYFNTQLTGIDRNKVKGAPNFAQLWEEIEPLMGSGILAAHNAVFDMSVLRRCLQDYGISWKASADYLCTVQIGRRVLPDMKHNLNIMCDHFGIALDHHQADSDSRACAEILLRYMNSGVDVSSFVRTYKL